MHQLKKSHLRYEGSAVIFINSDANWGVRFYGANSKANWVTVNDMLPVSAAGHGQLGVDPDVSNPNSTAKR